MSFLTQFFKFREKSDGEVVKPFLDHMEDLRWTIIKLVATIIVTMGASFFFRTDLMRILQAPLEKVDPALKGSLIVTGIADSFIISLQLAFYCGIIIAFPALSYFVAEFVLPALTKQEKRFLLPGIAAGFALFLAGVLVSYEYILPKTLDFFWHDAKKMGVTTFWTWRDYLSFSSWLTIGFGLMCELPAAVVVLAMFGLVSFKFLASTRPYAITLILVMCAVIAPTPDPLTLVTLAAPVSVLYEGCIWIVWLIERKRRIKAALPVADEP